MGIDNTPGSIGEISASPSDNRLLEWLLSKPLAPVILRQANRLLQEEGERREAFRNETSEREKAEFINGAVVVHSPVKLCHNRASTLLLNLLNTYVLKHKLGFVGHEKVMIALSRNDYEPNICYFNAVKTALFREDQTLFPAPDFVVEVLSKTTEKHDRGIKYEDYRSHGIGELLAHRPCIENRRAISFE